MAQDLRNLFKNEQKVSHQKMSEGHEARFLQKLDEALPEERSNKRFNFFSIAASIVVLIGLTFAGIKYTGEDPIETKPVEVVETPAGIESVSPQLKKVEDYYLASINAELAKIKYTPETKELFDGFVKRLGDLSSEYDLLSQELINSGPNEKTVTALIDNLKMRLNLLYRLKEKLNELNTDSFEQTRF